MTTIDRAVLADEIERAWRDYGSDFTNDHHTRGEAFGAGYLAGHAAALRRPTPEAGKLPSEEELCYLLLVSQHGKGAADDAVKWRDGRFRIAETSAHAVRLALLTPAQPHDVPADTP